MVKNDIKNEKKFLSAWPTGKVKFQNVFKMLGKVASPFFYGI